MNPSPPFDLTLAHSWFSADCFNRVWGYLDNSDRTADDNESMLSLAHASIAHWRDREDCTSQNLSIGYWMLSRVYSVLGKADSACHYGKLCLDASAEEPPFFLGYAHEAIARAEKLIGHEEAFRAHLETARTFAEKVEDHEDRELLDSDLAELESA